MLARSLAALVVCLATLAAASQAKPPEPEGVGSCYEVRPICMPPQSPLCMCDQTMNCFWVCK